MTNSFIEDYTNLFNKGDFDNVLACIKDNFIIHNGYLYVSSPFTGNECQAICSKNEQGSQIILFKSLIGDECWALVQSMNFIDVVVNKDEFIVVTKKFFQDQVKIAREYLEKYSDITTKHAAEFGGFLLNNNRPYHYFYDGLKSLIAWRDIGIVYSVAIGDGFYDISRLGFNTVSINKNKVYLKPSIIGQNYSTVDANSSRKYMEGLETLLKDKTEKNNFFKRTSYNKVFWLGITGQKRSWVEQISGYANIINLLSRHFPKSMFVIDGMTSSVNTRLESIEEDLILVEIKKLLDNTYEEIFHMKGFTYEEKISIASDCDFYIANSGTGCMVPQRICALPGVIHSNGSLYAFMNHEPKSCLGTIEEKNIYKVSESKQPAMFQSYSIPWQAVYNSLISVINEVDSSDIKSEPMPINYQPIPDDVSLSNTLLLRVNKHGISNRQLVETLKELSSVFERSGNRSAALDVMKYALLLRPDGKFIINKIKSLL